MRNLGSVNIFGFALFVIVSLYIYYTSARRRALQRKLRKMLAANAEITEALESAVHRFEEKWDSDLAKREQEIAALLHKNRIQIQTIDELTGALKVYASRIGEVSRPRTAPSSPNSHRRHEKHGVKMRTREQHENSNSEKRFSYPFQKFRRVEKVISSPASSSFRGKRTESRSPSAGRR